MNKNKLFVISFLLMVFIVSCNNTQQINEEVNETDYGQLVFFEYENTELSINDTVVAHVTNYTGVINIYEYCGVPFVVLKRKNTYWEYVWPDIDECGLPNSTVIVETVSFDLDNLVLKDGNHLSPGEHMIKIYYSTAGPGLYMREYKQVVWIEE